MSALRVWVMGVESYGRRYYRADIYSIQVAHDAAHHIEIRALLDLVCNILSCLYSCCGLSKHRAEGREAGLLLLVNLWV